MLNPVRPVHRLQGVGAPIYAGLNHPAYAGGAGGRRGHRRSVFRAAVACLLRGRTGNAVVSSVCNALCCSNVITACQNCAVLVLHGNGQHSNRRKHNQQETIKSQHSTCVAYQSQAGSADARAFAFTRSLLPCIVIAYL